MSNILNINRELWNLRVNDRLSAWRQFRAEIDKLPLEEALNYTNILWNSAPYVTYYISPDDPSNWPDPWTLLAENYYCDLAKALGMLYTLYFTSHKVSLDLDIYYNYKNKERYNLVQINGGKYILNYWPDEIVNTKQIEEEKLKKLYQYSSSDLQLEKY